MTAPVAPQTSRARLLAAVAALAAAAVTAGIMTQGGQPTGGDPCGGAPLLVMRALDTTQTRLVEDTLFVVRGDTTTSAPLVSPDSQHFDIHVDSGSTFQLVAACVPASRSFRIRLVQDLPAEALAHPTAARLAYAALTP